MLLVFTWVTEFFGPLFLCLETGQQTQGLLISAILQSLVSLHVTLREVRVCVLIKMIVGESYSLRLHERSAVYYFCRRVCLNYALIPDLSALPPSLL